MAGAKRMFEPRMVGAGVNQKRQAKLLDPPKSLHVWMFYQIEHQVRLQIDESEHRIVYYFLLVDKIVSHLFLFIRRLKIQKFN